jgi:hypothetical protein
MKIIFIAHPVGGDVIGNLKKITDIGRKINLEEPEVVPFVPYYFDCQCLNDSIPEERARGIKNDIALFRRGFIDELRLYGNKISQGMITEIALAQELNIPIVPMTEETKKGYEVIKHKN